MQEQIIPVIFGFVVLGMLSVMVDMITLFLEKVMERTPKLPNYFNNVIRYIIVSTLASFWCWQFNYQIFAYFGLYAKWEFLNWLISALIIGGGSPLVRKQFQITDEIPSILRGINTTIRKSVAPIKENSNTPKQKETKNDYEGRV